jgi:prepilin-type processing-associated H-X9-DG protein
MSSSIKVNQPTMGALLRTIAIGDKNISTKRTFLPDGDLNTGPVGLGYLLWGGYMSDAHVYYCPSSRGMPSDRGDLLIHNLTHWKTAGGFDAKTMLYGDWSKRDYQWSNTYYCIAIQSHYAHRNAVLWFMNPNHYVNHLKTRYGLPGTRPAVNPLPGQATFKTDRLLQGRAIVADVFAKGWYKDGRGNPIPSSGVTLAETATYPGMGVSAHRTAYNVLYGDGHVKLFGDPQERMVWHMQGTGTSARNAAPHALLSNYVYGTWAFVTPAGDPDNAYFTNCSLRPWHDFDVAAGIDVPQP